MSLRAQTPQVVDLRRKRRACSIRPAASSRRCPNSARRRSTSSTPTPSGSISGEPNLKRLALAWDAASMDILLMLADLDSATGHTGSTDFLVGPDGALQRAARRSGRADLCGRGDRQPAHLRRRARRAAVAQPLFRRGDRRGPAVRHEDARQLDHGRHARRHPAGRSRRRPRAGRSGMSGRAAPRVLSIPPGAAFLPTLADALLSGRLVPDFRHGGDPLALAGVTIYVPTRRAARELRSIFVERSAGGSAILPTDPPARRIRRGRGGSSTPKARARSTLRRRSRPSTACSSGAAGARLEEAAAGPCRGAVRGRVGRAGLGRRCRSGWRATSPR